MSASREGWPSFATAQVENGGHPLLRAAAECAPARRDVGIGGGVAVICDRPGGKRRSPLSKGAAPEALKGLPAPGAIFVGGGASAGGTLDAAMAALRPGGRLVVNAVTLETEAALIERHAREGGTLARIAVSRADRIGSKTGWRPAMPVTQWTWVKP